MRTALLTRSRLLARLALVAILLASVMPASLAAASAAFWCCEAEAGFCHEDVECADACAIPLTPDQCSHPADEHPVGDPCPQHRCCHAHPAAAAAILIAPFSLPAMSETSGCPPLRQSAGSLNPDPLLYPPQR